MTKLYTSMFLVINLRIMGVWKVGTEHVSTYKPFEPAFT